MKDITVLLYWTNMREITLTIQILNSIFQLFVRYNKTVTTLWIGEYPKLSTPLGLFLMKANLVKFLFLSTAHYWTDNGLVWCQTHYDATYQNNGQFEDPVWELNIWQFIVIVEIKYFLNLNEYYLPIEWGWQFWIFTDSEGRNCFIIQNKQLKYTV
jgi:hypothetical protein